MKVEIMSNKIITFTVNVHKVGGQEKLSIVVALLWKVKHYSGHFSQKTSHTLLICTLGPACTPPRSRVVFSWLRPQNTARPAVYQVSEASVRQS